MYRASAVTARAAAEGRCLGAVHRDEQGEKTPHEKQSDAAPHHRARTRMKNISYTAYLSVGLTDKRMGQRV